MTDNQLVWTTTIARLQDVWRDRAKALGLPAKGVKRDDACLNFLVGASTALKPYGVNIASFVFMVSVRGASELERWEVPTAD